MSDAAPGRHVGSREGDPPEEDIEDVDGGWSTGLTVPTFPRKPFLRTGYDRVAVDELVTKIVLAVHDDRQTTVSADDVARMRFPGRRFGSGYRMREVDDYLGAAEALLRMRATTGGVHRAVSADSGHHEERHHHPTWWIYGIALLLVAVVVVFTLTQT